MEDTARERRLAYRREWYAKNKERQREYERRCRRKKAELKQKKTEKNGKDGSEE